MVVLDRCGRRCGGRCGDRGRFVLRQRQLERSRLRARQSGGLPMKRGVPFLLGLISLSACKSDVVTQQGLFVTVDNPSSVAGIVKLKVILSNEGTDTTLTFPSTPQTTPIVFPTSFSVSVPATHSGEVDMAISGFNVSGAVVANATAFKVLQAGTFVTVTVTLQPGAAPGAGGTTGAVGTGGATGFDATPLDAGIDRSADVEISADGIGGGGGSGGFGVGGDGPPGQGGAKGTGGAPGLDASQPDAVMADALDAPLGGLGGAGGAIGSGGIVGTGGAASTGGIVGTGGATGAGGTTAICQDNATQCSGTALQTCTNGQWGTAVACGPLQTCSGPTGTAKCTCNEDPVCSSVGSTCENPSKLATCTRDSYGCIYESSAVPCTNGACSGPVGSATCCTNACTSGATCLSSTSLQTCAVGANGCTAATTSTCSVCTGAAGSATCCTNACTAGATCLSSTSLQSCAVGTNGCTASSTTTCSTGQVCERGGTASCADPNWDEWPIPNSQVDVTAGAPNLESYTNNGDGTVTDNITGLMWQQAVPSATYTWALAVAYCSTTLTLAGYSDWRLPSAIELMSIVDLGQSNPSINGTYFPSTPSTVFWSSSPVAGSPSLAWYVPSYLGNTSSNAITLAANVRCVR